MVACHLACRQFPIDHQLHLWASKEIRHVVHWHSLTQVVLSFRSIYRCCIFDAASCIKCSSAFLIVFAFQVEICKLLLSLGACVTHMTDGGITCHCFCFPFCGFAAVCLCLERSGSLVTNLVFTHFLLLQLLLLLLPLLLSFHWLLKAAAHSLLTGMMAVHRAAQVQNFFCT